MDSRPPKPSVPRTPATRELEPYKDQFREWYIDHDCTLPEVQQLFKERCGLDAQTMGTPSTSMENPKD
ncbi:MAG: hypothetical protein Q9187_003420 [Circinaria calcarea]